MNEKEIFLKENESFINLYFGDVTNIIKNQHDFNFQIFSKIVQWFQKIVKHEIESTDVYDEHRLLKEMIYLNCKFNRKSNINIEENFFNNQRYYSKKSQLLARRPHLIQTFFDDVPT